MILISNNLCIYLLIRYILFVRKNALQILIPKYGLEGTLYLNNDDTDKKDERKVKFTYNEEVTYKHLYIIALL